MDPDSYKISEQAETSKLLGVQRRVKLAKISRVLGDRQNPIENSKLKPE